MSYTFSLLGRKPHICTICGKGYAQESSMKTHMRTHQSKSMVNVCLKKFLKNQTTRFFY